MADRGRDLKISVLSDTSRFDLSGPADELEELGDTSKDTADDIEAARDELKRLAAQGQDAQKQLDALNREVADSRFEELGRDAKTTADKVDRAFDSIAKSAKTNMRKVNTEVEDAGHEGFKGLKDEAHQSGREAAASFGGGFDDITSLVQEIAATAFEGFGPGGAILGLAAAAGIGLAGALFGKSQEDAERLQEAVQGWVDALIEGGGKIEQAAIDSKIKELFSTKESRQEIEALAKTAKTAGVDVSTFVRAYAGDPAAIRKTTDAIKGQSDALDKNSSALVKPTQKVLNQRAALQKLAKELGTTTQGIKDGTDAYKLMDKAMRQGITSNVEVKTPTARELANERAEMQKGLGGKPIPVPIKVQPPPPVGAGSSANAAEQALRQAQAYANAHPITLRVTAQGAAHDTGSRAVR